MIPIEINFKYDLGDIVEISNRIGERFRIIGRHYEEVIHFDEYDNLHVVEEIFYTVVSTSAFVEEMYPEDRITKLLVRMPFREVKEIRDEREKASKKRYSKPSREMAKDKIDDLLEMYMITKDDKYKDWIVELTEVLNKGYSEQILDKIEEINNRKDYPKHRFEENDK